MRKITFFKTAFLAVIMMATVASASAQTSVATTADLRTAGALLAIGSTSTGTYTLTGEVVINFISTSSTGAKTMYVQDATGGIMIYGSSSYISNTYHLHDGLKNVTGTLKNYYGATEIMLTIDPGVASSTANTPIAPVVTTIDQLINYPFQVATVNNVTISDQTSGGTGLFVYSKNFPLSVGGVTSSTVFLRTSYSDANYINAAVPTSAAQNLTGLVLPYQYNATSALTVDFIPRSSSDIPLLPTGFESVKANFLNVSLAGKNLSITNVSNGSTVDVYSSVGARVQSSKLENGAILLNDLSKGIYVVRVGNMTSKIML